MKIFLDPGHGGKDSGAIGNGLVEKNINLIVANKVRDILILKGLNVELSRNKDIYISLEERCRLANKCNADIFISIHHNAGGGNGFEIIHSIYNGKGLDLANNISKEFTYIGQKLRKVYSKKNISNGRDYYAVIRGTKMPAIITEYAFIDSNDSIKINSIDKLHVEARAIANGIINFFEI